MAKQNFLLGRRERLTSDIVVKSGRGPKNAPYSFREAKTRLSPMVAETSSRLDALPPEACPADEAVISFALNPEYIAKSYFPVELMRDVGIDVVAVSRGKSHLRSARAVASPPKL